MCRKGAFSTLSNSLNLRHPAAIDMGPETYTSWDAGTGPTCDKRLIKGNLAHADFCCASVFLTTVAVRCNEANVILCVSAPANRSLTRPLPSSKIRANDWANHLALSHRRGTRRRRDGNRIQGRG